MNFTYLLYINWRERLEIARKILSYKLLFFFTLNNNNGKIIII